MSDAVATPDLMRALLVEKMQRLSVTPYRVAKDIATHHPQLYEVLHNDRALSPLLALKLGTYLGIQPERLLALQAARLIGDLRIQHADLLQTIKQRAPSEPS